MEEFKKEKNTNQSLEQRIKFCLQDYANEFLSISFKLMGSQIEGVRKLFKEGHKVKTVEEHLKDYEEQGRETLSKEDQIEPVFVEKVLKINEYVEQINLLGENIKEQKLNEIITKVKEIIYN